MAEPLLLGQYHDAVTSALKEIAWVRDADAYPEKTYRAFPGCPHLRCIFPLMAGSRGR